MVNIVFNPLGVGFEGDGAGTAGLRSLVALVASAWLRWCDCFLVCYGSGWSALGFLVWLITFIWVCVTRVAW